MDKKHSSMEMYIKDNIRIIDLMGMVLINGIIKPFIKETLKIIKNMEKENILTNKQNILAIILKDINKDMDKYIILMEIFIKVT